MTPVEVAPRSSLRTVWSLSCCAAVSDFVRIWKLVYRSPPGEEPRPWTTASDLPILPISSRTFERAVGVVVLNVTCVPPLKSMPRFRPLTAITTTLSTIAIVAAVSQIRRRFGPQTSIRCQSEIVCPVAPMKRGLSNQRNPASRPSIARVAATAVTSEITVPSSSISAKPFTWAVAAAKRTNAVMQVTTFASTIVWKPRW